MWFNMKILIVDDEKNIQKLLSDILKDNGWATFVAGDVQEADRILQREFIDVMLLDVFLQHERQGLDFLKKVRTTYEFPPEVIMITGHGSIEMAVEALRDGAYDFIEKPPSMERLLLATSHAYDWIRSIRKNLYIKEETTPIIGESSQLKKIMDIVHSVAPTDGSVLVTGESGVGKELIARSIHLNSKRKEGPFVVINSAAIPEELVESELFGHEKGAFTNAMKLKRGKFELADGGTLFLDEIGDMSLKTQSKILRAIQEKTIERVGSESHLNVNVRIIAATNKAIAEMASSGTFREDLYYRLNVVTVDILPLRERTRDITPLFDHYIGYFSAEYGKPVREIDDDIYAYIIDCQWPGNVRELKNFAERAVIFSREGVISLGRMNIFTTSQGDKADFKKLADARIQFEKEYIKNALTASKGNVASSARLLGMDRSNLLKKIKALGIEIENS